MSYNNQKYVCAMLFGGVSLGFGMSAHTEFLADSKGEQEARNLSFNRDFCQDARGPLW
ncbi:hypothetical protein AABC73_19755 [Pseudomonas sp. G.S.17]|uniref:hypothetical protein n=1 Tax=Pseudomonas sp. G.S.17 TaxID=3137451 RepID=UPI00311CBC33